MSPNYARIIQQHYGLNRELTPSEIAFELKQLRRARRQGSLDSFQAMLASALGFRHPESIN